MLQNLSTVEDTRAAYEKIMDMKIATPQIILNYTSFLQKHKFWEDSFRVFERAVHMFSWPHVYDIWLTYVSKFIERHSDRKIERIRDMFSQILKSAPKDKIKLFFYMYADFEENFGLISHALAIYDRAVKELQS